MNTREIILDILLELAKEQEYSNVLIGAVLDKYDYLTAKEKAFIKRVSEGVLERRLQIDYVLNLYSKTSVEKMKPLIRELLRMSVYQLLFMENIPDSAVCNEAVKLAKKRRFDALKGYVNGVLRSVARNKEHIPYPDKEKERLRYLSVCYSMPLWLVEHFENAYGKERCEKILEAFLERGTVSVRLREDLPAGKREELMETWQKAGVTVVQHPYLSCAAGLDKVEGVRRLCGYEEGFFAVQDVSSMLAVEAAGIRQGDTVIDVCAAPGGKTLYAADRLSGTGQVIACDISEKKVQRIEKNRARLGRNNVTIRVQDARERDESLCEKGDVALADLPCSGLGVIGKKQDIKYRVTKESMQELVLLQKEILQNVVDYVKPGGILLYSTCTMNPAENEDMVKWICEAFPFQAESMAPYLPGQLKEEGEKGYLQLLPGIHETDGFFLARLRKQE